jgi:antitoxin VapB
MITAKIFRSGNSQAVRLPKQYEFKAKEVEIFQRGDEIVLCEKGRGMTRAFELLAGLPEDVFPKRRKKGAPPRRKGL